MTRDEQGLEDLGRILIRLHQFRDEALAAQDWPLWEWYNEGIAVVVKQHVRLATRMTKEKGVKRLHLNKREKTTDTPPIGESI